MTALMELDRLEVYLGDCRELVLAELRNIVPAPRYGPVLYDLMFDYPLRGGKSFRPSLCIAACRGLGGRLEDVVPSASILELYHNAFLIHDDIEDDSLLRRGAPTLHQTHGTGIAVNVGDGMFALALKPLLDNMSFLGLGAAMRIMQIVARMARESVEGQAVELDWVRRGRWTLRDQDYVRMCYKKTCWYSFMAPLQIGAVIAGAPSACLAALRRYGSHVGVAFQIQDDVLNLVASEERYGKEIGGDLWEGKHTLILIHMLRQASEADRREAVRILELPRPEKDERGVRKLFDLVKKYDSIEYARAFADRLARSALEHLETAYEWMPASVHREFLATMANHVVSRDR